MSMTRVKERMRGTLREKMMRMRMRVMGELLRREVQEAQWAGRTRHFILPMIWTVNDFKSTMTTKIFNNLRDRYQIPANIPIYLPRKYEKCYFRKTADVGVYNAMFVAGLRLPLTALHR